MNTPHTWKNNTENTCFVIKCNKFLDCSALEMQINALFNEINHFMWLIGDQLGDKCFRWNNRKNEIWTQTLP